MAKNIIFRTIIIISVFIFLPFNLQAASLKLIKQDMPFTSQAPLSEWKDSRFQDACEEASVLMAMKWVSGGVIRNRQEARSEILKIVAYEKRKYFNYHDTSAQDTATQLIGGYYDYDNYEVREVKKVADIINELKKGRIVIVPTDGRLLKNPNFTQPGPERHMLVVKGYDFVNKLFITNDPGTRNGESYKYSEKILFSAIRDYPTGYKKKIKENKKNMIIVWKNEKK